MTGLLRFCFLLWNFKIYLSLFQDRMEMVLKAPNLRSNDSVVSWPKPKLGGAHPQPFSVSPSSQECTLALVILMEGRAGAASCIQCYCLVRFQAWQEIISLPGTNKKDHPFLREHRQQRLHSGNCGCPEAHQAWQADQTRATSIALSSDRTGVHPSRGTCQLGISSKHALHSSLSPPSVKQKQ
jgi:hypothetical protein